MVGLCTWRRSLGVSLRNVFLLLFSLSFSVYLNVACHSELGECMRERDEISCYSPDRLVLLMEILKRKHKGKHEAEKKRSTSDVIPRHSWNLRLGDLLWVTVRCCQDQLMAPPPTSIVGGRGGGGHYTWHQTGDHRTRQDVQT